MSSENASNPQSVMIKKMIEVETSNLAKLRASTQEYRKLARQGQLQVAATQGALFVLEQLLKADTPVPTPDASKPAEKSQGTTS